MNRDNYASLPASKRLVEAGIVLETEAVWFWCRENTGMKPYETPQLSLRENLAKGVMDFEFPAPSMAEVWRELPESERLLKLIAEYVDSFYHDIEEYRFLDLLRSIDCLIDLKIWIVREGKP